MGIKQTNTPKKLLWVYLQLVWFGLVWYCQVWFGLVERVLMFDNFWLDLVVLVLTTFFAQFCSDFHKQERKKEKEKDNGLKYRVAAQLKILVLQVDKYSQCFYISPPRCAPSGIREICFSYLSSLYQNCSTFLGVGPI